MVLLPAEEKTPNDGEKFVGNADGGCRRKQGNHPGLPSPPCTMKENQSRRNSTRKGSNIARLSVAISPNPNQSNIMIMKSSVSWETPIEYMRKAFISVIFINP